MKFFSLYVTCQLYNTHRHRHIQISTQQQATRFVNVAPKCFFPCNSKQNDNDDNDNDNHNDDDDGGGDDLMVPTQSLRTSHSHISNFKVAKVIDRSGKWFESWIPMWDPTHTHTNRHTGTHISLPVGQTIVDTIVSLRANFLPFLPIHQILNAHFYIVVRVCFTLCECVCVGVYECCMQNKSKSPLSLGYQWQLVRLQSPRCYSGKLRWWWLTSTATTT